MNPNKKEVRGTGDHEHVGEPSITHEQFRESIKKCNDIIEHTVMINGSDSRHVTLFYCDGMIDHQQMQLGLLPQLDDWAKYIFSQAEVHEHPIDKKSALFSKVDTDEGADDLFAYLFSGCVILLFEGLREFYEYNIGSQPGRSPEESTMELSLKGPRDGFVEQLSTNVALVRKRLRTPQMHVQYLRIGTHSQTEVAILHLDDKAKPKLVKETIERIENIHIPSLNGAGHLEELVSDRPFSFFPLVDYVGRPDYVVQSMMNGRVAILVDGAPAALIAPGNFLLLIKSPEDMHLPFYFVTLERLLRLIGLVLSICLPAFWIALCSFNTDQIPFQLLATITISRMGLPLSSTMEMFLMLTMFELFREAGVRLPRPVGQTVSVVGGLIVGDAAIRAGLTSPTMLVVAAVTAVSTFTLVNQSLAGTVSIIRYLVLILASALGMFGFMVGTLAVIIYICSLESFGMPYMTPIAPPNFKQWFTALFQLPWKVRSSERRGRR